MSAVPYFVVENLFPEVLLMNYFYGLVGNKKAFNDLSTFINVGFKPNSLLLRGPAGVGKMSAARIFARLQNCTGDRTPNCKCNSCLKFAQGVTPNMLEFNSVLNKDALRSIRSRTSLKVASGDTFIILRTEFIPLDYQDIFLKVLEEPTPNLHFILVSSTIAPKSPIVSRSNMVSFAPCTLEELNLYLKSNSFTMNKLKSMPSDELKFVLAYSEGSPGRLLKVMTDSQMKTHIKLAQQFLQSDPAPEFVGQLDGIAKDPSSRSFWAFKDLLVSVIRSALNGLMPIKDLNPSLTPQSLQYLLTKLQAPAPLGMERWQLVNLYQEVHS